MEITPQFLSDLAKEDAELKRRYKDFADKKRLVVEKLGEGQHLGLNGEKVTVVFPAPSLAPKEEALPEVRELVGDSVFKKLFERSVKWSPVKACREIAAKLLTPGVVKKFEALCDKPAEPRVVFGKA